MSTGTLTEDPPTKQTPLPEARRRGTLLIVDDEDGARMAAQMVFKDTYTVLLASDGATAIALAEKQPVDVVLLDIRMANMSGITTLEKLKLVDPSIEVVMMTAFETTDTIRQALRLRAFDYINKPFDLATLRSAISGAMQRRTLDSEITDNQEKLQELMIELQNQKIAVQRNSTRGEIYASIIHDLNGPLTVISGFVQLLNQRIGAASTLNQADLDFVKERLKTITRQVTNCIEISRRYLGFLKHQPGECSRFGVNQLLNDLNHLVVVHPTKKQNTFEIQPLALDTGIRMPGTDLIQLLLNLTINGFQCSAEPHEVSICGELLEQPLDLSAFKDGDNDRFLNLENFANEGPTLKLSVKDSGPGIPAELMPKIFQPFFTTKGPQNGTGLGLNIVQRIIREAKGILHLHTKSGAGTTFTIYLPAGPLPVAITN